MNKGIGSDEEICLIINKYKNSLNQANEAYRCIRTLIVNDYFIEKTRIYMQKEIFFVERFKTTSYTIYLLIGRSHTESNEFNRRWYR